MTTFFTADLHLGHSNIIGYCNRPFTDVDAMNRALIENWNRVVSTDDTVWVAGDFALGKIADTLPLAAALNGRKILVAGNHDRCWSGHGERAEGWTQQYLDAGFAEVIQGAAHVVLGEHRVLVCHFPYHGDSQEQDRYTEARPVDKGEWLLHGHVHERWLQNGRMINVGVDTNDFTPVSAAALVRRIENGPANASSASVRGSGCSTAGRDPRLSEELGQTQPRAIE